MNSSTNDKLFVTEQSHIADSYRLGEIIYASGYRPTFIVGLWRGGSTVALAVQECLAYLGVATDHTTIRTSYEGRPQYERSTAAKEGIRVHGKSYALEALSADDRLLIVDDVYRSGRHTRAVVDQLSTGLRRNVLFVGNQNHGVARLLDVPKQLHDLFRGRRIEVSRGLIT